MYVLYNNKYYLMLNVINQLVPTDNIDEALKFADRSKAENALNNLPKQTRNLGYAVMAIARLDKEVNHDLVNYDSALEQIGAFCNLHNQLASRADWVEDKLNEIEGKIQDVLHAIEFNSYNARDGYKMYKILHDLRIERRAYKDEQLIAGILTSGFNGAKWDTVLHRVDDLKGREYKARHMKELFEE